jgi:hypothetical protein
MYLNTRPSFQTKIIAPECNLKLKDERLQYKWSEFDYRCEKESYLSTPHSIKKVRHIRAIDKYKRKIFIIGSDLNTYEMRTGDFSVKMWATRT